MLKEVELQLERRRELREALAKRTQGLLDCSGFQDIQQLKSTLNTLGCGGQYYMSCNCVLDDYLATEAMIPTLGEAVAKNVAKNAYKIYQLIHQNDADADEYSSWGRFSRHRDEWNGVRSIYDLDEWITKLRR